VDHEDQGHVETFFRKSRGSTQAAPTTTAAASATTTAVRGVDKMSNYYTLISAPHSISMSVSWVGLVVATLIAIWGFMQLG
jgi:ABC-type transport system involved in cytochrome bd biosynthesis fused ATPase/permease subunit